MKRMVALALAASVLAPGVAGAATVLRQDYIANGGGLGGSTFQVYDDFKLSQTTSIVALSWWAQDFAVNTRTFQIRFTDANGIYPNAATPIYSATVVATGVNVGLYTYRFDANLAAPATLAGNTNLFLSVSADGFTWGRASNHPSGGSLGFGSLADSYNVATGAHTLQAMDLAWALYDTPFAVAGVPEPGSWAMMIAGFGVIGATIRYRRKRTGMAFA